MGAARQTSTETPDFESLYARDADPWRVGSSWYEQRKLAIVLASLPRSRYRSAWEPGCGPGIISSALSRRVEVLVGSDLSPRAVQLAQRRCSGLDNVRFTVSELPEVPLPVAGQVELVVVAEFLYYVADLSAALGALWSAAEPGAQLVFLHWGHRPDDAFRSGPSMHAEIAVDSIDRDARRLVTHVDSDFVLDIYEAPR